MSKERKLFPNLIEKGKKRLIARSPLPGEKITLLTKLPAREAEKAGRITTAATTTPDGKKGPRVVTAAIIEGPGEIKPKRESWYAKVRPIFEEIVRQRGKKTVLADSETLVQEQRKTNRGHPVLGNSLAGRALIASEIREKAQGNNTLAEESRLQHQGAQETLAQLRIEEISQRASEASQPEKRGLLRKIGDGLTSGAAAALVGEPRAATEELKVSVGREIVAVNAPTRKTGKTEIPMKKVIDGTYQVECKLDPLSRLVNVGRAVIGKKPVAVFGRGAVTLRNVWTDEIAASSLEKDPLAKVERMREAVSAMRDLQQPLLLPRPVPSYADLGLSGPELEKQSGVNLPKSKK